MYMHTIDNQTFLQYHYPVNCIFHDNSLFVIADKPLTQSDMKRFSVAKRRITYRVQYEICLVVRVPDTSSNETYDMSSNDTIRGVFETNSNDYILTYNVSVIVSS